jgi:hypothetical protein
MTLDEDLINGSKRLTESSKLDYHLYIEFWSNREKEKEHIILIVERDFANMAELYLTKEKIREALGGKL